MQRLFVMLGVASCLSAALLNGLATLYSDVDDHTLFHIVGAGQGFAVKTGEGVRVHGV